ncbi:nucleolar complex protein-like protein [Saccharata proteae CBS 121410]|uniref:Nucleolar complex protein-like protein n=1 Tax=Saccharata proteae CBS 121410 TaxID=1314787 RepID=A0A9P4HWI7_9PEZI|nr:nucleolar complex protein-like protein [Saccharata proteae CBS 121410]
MPYLAPDATAGKKRKRVGDAGVPEKAQKAGVKPKSRTKATATDSDDAQSHVLLLENQILESRRHYNNIATLVSMAKEEDTAGETAITAAVALCRVFCRLMAAGNMVKSHGLSDQETMIVKWLKERYQESIDVLVCFLHGKNPVRHSTAMTLLMRLVKEEVAGQKGQGDQAWRQGVFLKLVHALLDSEESGLARDEFLENFVEEYDDVRFYTLVAINTCLKDKGSSQARDALVGNCLAVLVSVDVPDSKEDLEDFYCGRPENAKHQLLSISAHKRQGQDAWLALLRSGLNKDQRKTVLGNMTYRVTPWFSKAEVLMDFLTDSYNQGGGTSLLALSGLFFLISEKNLDYPSFYQKLYTLLDSGLLHSKHRSRFFRLLDTFMSSTHLPAVLVASFIKRLSRLALHAPPAGIVAVIPWVYNMLMKHPACTFMVHRVPQDPAARKQLEEQGMDDPFNMEESDPMQTDAIESSLWEIQTLQSHYHPNVATLAKIISEQFTKRSYNLEDFLDHSYQGLIDAELGKEMKKTPVVEYDIPKRIFTTEDAELGLMGGLMAQVLQSG